MLIPTHKFRVITLQPSIKSSLCRFLLHNPLRKTASAPFSANIRSGTDNHIKPEIFRHFQKVIQFFHIQTRFILRRTRHSPFMPVPGNIRLHTIKTTFLQLSETVCPQRLSHTKIMECSTEYEHIFPFNPYASPIIADSIWMNKHRVVYRRYLCPVFDESVCCSIVHDSHIRDILG